MNGAPNETRIHSCKFASLASNHYATRACVSQEIGFRKKNADWMIDRIYDLFLYIFSPSVFEFYHPSIHPFIVVL